MLKLKLAEPNWIFPCLLNNINEKGYVWMLILIIHLSIHFNNNLKFYFIKLIYDLTLGYSMPYYRKAYKSKLILIYKIMSTLITMIELKRNK